MKRALVLAIIAVTATASPKFGERLAKTDKQNATDILSVFRPTGQTQAKDGVVANNQLKASDSKQKPTIERKKENQTQRVDNNPKDFEINERHVEYEFSATHQTSHNNSNDNNTDSSTQPVLERRSGQLNQRVEPKTRHRHFAFPPPPDFSEFQFSIPDITELAGSEQISGLPVPPPPPRAPARHSPLSGFRHFQPSNNHQERNYDQSPDEDSFFQSSPSESSHGYEQDFGSFGIPRGFPPPNKDHLRSNFKQERMGIQNMEGKPFGQKRSYTYRDPKNPNNFMELSEVTMTVNREMDPQEAQSQIQQFIAAAQSGQYGPVREVSSDDQHSDERHPNHNYQSEGSQFAPPEPKEPIEPKFPNFR